MYVDTMLNIQRQSGSTFHRTERLTHGRVGRAASRRRENLKVYVELETTLAIRLAKLMSL